MQQRMIAVHRLVLQADVVFLMPADPHEVVAQRHGPRRVALR